MIIFAIDRVLHLPWLLVQGNNRLISAFCPAAQGAKASEGTDALTSVFAIVNGPKCTSNYHEKMN